MLLISDASNVNSMSTLPDSLFVINAFSAVTCFPSMNRGSPVVLSIRTPFRVYSCPIMRFLYSTASIIDTFFFAIASCVPDSLSLAFVPMLCFGNTIVCPSSSISVCTATSVSCTYRLSKTTISFPFNSVASNENFTSTLPLFFSGTNTASAATSSPSINSGFPVDLSIRIPFRVYSSPAIRFLYFTVSTIDTLSLLTACFVPVSKFSADVSISCLGYSTV